MRRDKVRKLLATWRSNRLLQITVPLTCVYVVGLGLAIGNLGIIARQRIHVMPLLMLLLAAEAPATISKTTTQAAPLERSIIPQPASVSST